MQNLDRDALYRRFADDFGRAIGRGNSPGTAQRRVRAHRLEPVNTGPAGFAFNFDS